MLSEHEWALAVQGFINIEDIGGNFEIFADGLAAGNFCEERSYRRELVHSFLKIKLFWTHHKR
jgi:hypothetical protein